MNDKNFILQNFDSQIFGYPVYTYQPNSVLDIENVDAKIPKDAVLVSMRTPKSWTHLMPKTEFREIECLVIMERPPEKSTSNKLPANVRICSNFGTPEGTLHG